MPGRFRHCRAYALATLLVINLFPAIAYGVDVTQNVTVTGRVCTPEDATPIILSPAPDSTVKEAVITVSGSTTAPAVPVSLKRNGVAAGVTLPEPDGTWSLPVTLTPGSNVLIATACQNSTPVTVFYNPSQPTPQPDASPAVPASPGGTAGSPGPGAESAAPEGAEKSGGQRNAFYLTTAQGLIDGLANQDITLTADIHGGRPPYDFTLSWGDGSPDITRTFAQAGEQLFTHRFTAGTYKPLAKATDADGRQASLAYVVRIAPPAEVPGVVQKPPEPKDLLNLLLIEAGLTIVVFAGWEEIHQRHLLAGAGCPGVPT